MGEERGGTLSGARDRRGSGFGWCYLLSGVTVTDQMLNHFRGLKEGGSFGSWRNWLGTLADCGLGNAGEPETECGRCTSEFLSRSMAAGLRREP